MLNRNLQNVLFCLLIMLSNQDLSSVNIIYTVAGNDTFGYSGDGGAACEAQLASPKGVSIDKFGNLYIADTGNCRIRKVDTAGVITSFAGTGKRGYKGDEGPAILAELSYPQSIVIDPSGNVYIADTFNHCIRMVNTSGIITTFAGTGRRGYNGDEGPATEAELDFPTDVTIDAYGNVYIADAENHCIRRVNPSGIITTFAGIGTPGYKGDGGLATAAELNFPESLAIDLSGNVYIADSENYRIRKVDTSGIMTTFAGTGTHGSNGDGGPATLAELSYPRGIAIDLCGNIYIADQNDNRIRMVNTSGIMTTFAGTGMPGYNGDRIPAITAELDFPQDVVINLSGNIYIADAENNRIREVILSPTEVTKSTEATKPSGVTELIGTLCPTSPRRYPKKYHK